MKIPIPILMTITVWMIFLAYRRMKKVGKDYNMRKEEYIEKEREADSVRKKEIPEELYFKANIEEFPFEAVRETGKEKGKFARHERVIKAQSEKTMLRLDKPMTNREVKLEYGTANITPIMEYEENLENYVQSLNMFAHDLIECKMYEEAAIVLTECIRAESPVSKTYNMMADIFAWRGDREGLKELKTVVEGTCITPEIKEKIFRYIDDKIESVR